MAENYKRAHFITDICSAAIADIPDEFPLSGSPEQVFQRIGAGGFSLRKNRTISFSQPCLCIKEDTLFLFLTEERQFKNSRILCWSTTDLDDWFFEGIVLEEPYSVSYPFVFSHEGEMYMIPEYQNGGGVDLYSASEFPTGWKKYMRLIDFPLQNPSLFFKDGIGFLFGTHTEKGLLLFYANGLTEQWKVHPSSPNIQDPKYRSCGGIPFQQNEEWYRIAQDHSAENHVQLHLIKMEICTKETYKESLFRADFLPRNEKWNACGVSHFQALHFLGNKIAAFDGSEKDSFLNSVIRSVWNLFA